MKGKRGPPPGSPSAVGRCSRCGGSHKIVFGRTGNIVRGQSCATRRAPQAKNRKDALVSGGANETERGAKP